MSLGRTAALKPFVFALSTAAAPALAAEPFTLIVVPDTQNYTDFNDINQQYNVGQMRWIRDNMANLNVKFVMHLGDLQNPGNPYRAQAVPNQYQADLSRPLGDVDDKIAKWQRASAAINVLDNNDIPYSIVPGNHDYRNGSTKDEPYYYLENFGPDRRYVGKPSYGGASPESPAMPYAGLNTYHYFEGGGYRFLNLALQYQPDDHDIKWAQKIINENPGMPTILTTHAYVARNGYQHQYIYNEFVKNNPQILMSFNGHLTGSNREVETNIAGHQVHQMLADYQAVQLDAQLGGDYFRGGGVLRKVEFDLDADRVRIRDYSPIANAHLPNNFTAQQNDGTNRNFTASNFNFDLDLEARFGLPSGQGITRSTRFQHGVNGYNGTGDTYIDQNVGTASYGELDTIWVDGDRNGAASGSPDSQAMIRFNNIFGNGPGQIPMGAQIESAELVLHTSDRTNAQSPNTIALHRLLQNWTEAGAVWDTFNGFATDGIEAIQAENDSVIPNVRDGYVSFDVTESIYVWAAGATNMGWVLLPGGGNGWQFDSSEAAEAVLRPQLNVTYRVVPEPGAIASMACAGLFLLARRRRRSADQRRAA